MRKFILFTEAVLILGIGYYIITDNPRSSLEQNTPPVSPWPPIVGKAYPEVELHDQSGEIIKLSSFKGKIIIVEMIGMNCPACQAWSGAKEYGSFEGIKPQWGLPSFRKDFERYSDVSFNHPKIVFVQILLYNMQMGAPSINDAKRWAEHFSLKKENNHLVLAGTKDYLGKASYDLIPGFQLIDKNFTLRYDATGHWPKDSLYDELLPGVKKHLNE